MSTFQESERSGSAGHTRTTVPKAPIVKLGGVSEPEPAGRVDAWRTKVEHMAPIQEGEGAEVKSDDGVAADDEGHGVEEAAHAGEEKGGGSGDNTQGSGQARESEGDGLRSSIPGPAMSLRPSTDLEMSRRSINWLQHPKMLPAGIPGSRVLTFSYPSFHIFQASKLSLSDFVTAISDELWTQIDRLRPTPEHAAAPLLFVACGFGGLLVQSLLANDVPPVNEEESPGSQQGGRLMELTAGMVFIDAPFPAFQAVNPPPTDGKTKKDKERKGDHLVYGSLRMRRIAQFIWDNQMDKDGGGGVDSGLLWKKFDRGRSGLGEDQPIVWFYNKQKTKEVCSSRLRCNFVLT